MHSVPSRSAILTIKSVRRRGTAQPTQCCWSSNKNVQQRPFSRAFLRLAPDCVLHARQHEVWLHQRPRTNSQPQPYTPHIFLPSHTRCIGRRCVASLGAKMHTWDAGILCSNCICAAAFQYPGCANTRLLTCLVRTIEDGDTTPSIYYLAVAVRSDRSIALSKVDGSSVQHCHDQVPEACTRSLSHAIKTIRMCLDL